MTHNRNTQIMARTQVREIKHLLPKFIQRNIVISLLAQLQIFLRSIRFLQFLRCV